MSIVGSFAEFGTPKSVVRGTNRVGDPKQEYE